MLLSCIFSLLAAGATALLYIGCPTLSLWWILPLWVAFYLAAGVVFILWFFLTAWLLPDKTPSPRRYGVYHWFIVRLLSWVLRLLCIRVTLSGSERLPTDRPFLLVSNHLSNFDPLVTLAAFKKWSLGFVSKPENFRIPVIGMAMRKACFLAIDRENARNAVTTIRRAAEQINDMRLSMAIYPEGTRSRTGELLPFHAGSFKIAKMAKCPIAIITLRYEKRRLLCKNVRLQVVDILEEDYVTENGTAELCDRAVAAIRQGLEQK